MQMHTPDGRGMPVERVFTLPGVGVPHFERPVGGAGDHGEAVHLAGPDAARVADQGPQTPAGGGRPHLQRVVIGAAHDPVLRELQTRDHVVVVPVQNLRSGGGKT